MDGVFHVLDSRKNLVTASLLHQNGFTLVLGSNKIVISRFGSYVGKSHLPNGLYKISLMPFSNATLHFLCLFQMLNVVIHDMIGLGMLTLTLLKE